MKRLIISAIASLVMVFGIAAPAAANPVYAADWYMLGGQKVTDGASLALKCQIGQGTCARTDNFTPWFNSHANYNALICLRARNGGTGTSNLRVWWFDSAGTVEVWFYFTSNQYENQCKGVFIRSGSQGRVYIQTTQAISYMRYVLFS